MFQYNYSERHNMAENPISQDFETILNLLDLKSFYPEKLSRDDLYQITPDSIAVSEEEKRNPSRQFINNITRYNYHARNIHSKEIGTTQPVLSTRMGYRERSRRQRTLESSSVHPLEVTAAVFLCCNPTARQDLVMHLWGCRLAVPFLFQLSKDTKPNVFLWPLRSLIGYFQTGNGFVEMPFIKSPMKTIAFVRVGENEQLSKSYLLNCLIGGPEKSHSMFFHRNSEGSKRNRSIFIDGMIEIGWFLSADSTSDKLDGPRLFMNVRGNSEYLRAQTKFVGKLATVTIVLTTVSLLANARETISVLLTNGSRVILLLSDQNPDSNAIDNFLDKYFPDVPDTIFDIVTVEGCMLSELLGSLTHNITKLESQRSRQMSLVDFVKTLSNTEYYVDEAQQSYIKAITCTSRIVSMINETNMMERKKDLLALQEVYWKEWSQIDRDYWRFDQLDPDEKKKLRSKEHLEMKMRQIRKLQYQHFVKKGLSDPMALFVLSLFRFGTYERKVFLRMLKLELDNLSRTKLLPLDRKYQTLVDITINASEKERSEINQALSNIEVQKSKISFGLEHMIREIGQLFEACESQPEHSINIANEIDYNELPKLACFLMLEGYPVEILDGEACSVPLLWVKSVLNSLPSVLQEEKVISHQVNPLKVHVISVLGIQSSGKSTFLNTIFGLQFAVSAGRCTRGAFMQGVKVHPSMKRDIDVDYILAIDTEGLKAAELISGDSIKHDNELSTFIIGLADTTVINLMGENATYLQENLPIAVHAFLRMNLAGLHPRCTIVHHNVDKRNKEKLSTQGRILESVLNRLTIKACELERTPHRLFHDIIEFSIQKHTYYIPALYEGEQPMAPVSVGYSKESENVRKKLIGFMHSEMESSSLCYFARHLETLSKAMKRDKFVYEFRTTLETQARLELDQKYSDILMEYLTRIDEIIDSLLPKLTSQKQTLDQVEKKFLQSISSVETKYREELEHFIVKPKRFVDSCYEQWKDKYLTNLDDEMKHHRGSAVQQFRDHIDQLSLSLSMDKIESFFVLIDDISLSSKKSENESFDVAWFKWALSSNLIKQDISLLSDAAKALQDVCQSHKYLLAEKEIENKSINDFRPSTEKHLNHSFKKFSEKKIVTLKSKMNAIKESVQIEYNTELSNIRQKQMPYTDRHPKQILLRLERYLSDQLSVVNKGNEIAHQFKIDLLICIAGSIVYDFEGIIQSHMMLSQIKQNMKDIYLKKVRALRSSTEELLKMVFEVIRGKIQYDFPTFVPTCIVNTLKKSEWRGRIRSKQMLMGFCLNHLVAQGKDDLLSLFLSYPKRAVFRYLEILLERAISAEQFVPILEQFTRRVYSRVKTALELANIPDGTFEEIAETVMLQVGLNDNVAKLLRYKFRTYRHHKVKISLFKDLIERNMEVFITETTVELKHIISKHQNDIIPVCADILCSRLIGCQEVCPFCSEPCKYSFRHAGKHECFIHKPVGFTGVRNQEESGMLSFFSCPQHYQLNSIFEHPEGLFKFRDYKQLYPDWIIKPVYPEQSSVIWKWIFVNKYIVLEKSRLVQIPTHLPDSWTGITKKEVLRAIREIFELPH